MSRISNSIKNIIGFRVSLEDFIKLEEEQFQQYVDEHGQDYNYVEDDEEDEKHYKDVQMQEFFADRK